MKRIARRLTRTLSIMLISALCLSAGADFVPQESTTLPLSQEAALTDVLLRDDVSGALRKERTVNYTPGGATLPRVVYGTTLYGETAMDVIEAYPAAWGYTVLAGVNGSFFDVGTGNPVGCVVTDGALRTSGDFEAVGFRADGSAIIGKPGVAVKATFPDGATLDCHLNKTLTRTNGLMLYSRDYDSRTKNAQTAFHVGLTTEEPDLLLGTTRTATVTGSWEGVSCAIPEGGFLLTMPLDTEYPSTLQERLRPLQPGDEIRISVEIDPAWADVVCICSGMEILVENGAAKSDFLLPSAKQRPARTAVGVREDGSVVFYTVDSAGGSTGMTLAELADKMLSLGCVNALNLDGGGSTALRALLPGTDGTQTMGSPSDGKLRRCANFIFLLRETAEAGEAARLFAYPYGAYLLPGGSVDLTVTATDAQIRKTALPEGLTLTAEGGELTDGAFTATSPGAATVTMTAGEVTGSLALTVLETPDSVTIFREADGKSGGGSLFCGETLDFTAQANYLGKVVYASDRSFVWSCDSAVGAIDENGLFTAVKTYTPVKGDIRCAAGEKENRVTVTVLPDYPFPDTEYHWAREPVKTMYDKGVLKGSEVDGVPFFRPDDPMTRQEFLTALVRSLGADTTQYDGTELPFADADAIADWALPALRAAYALGYLSGSAQGDSLYALPQSPISRQEAMTILSRTLPAEEVQPEDDPLAVFPDADAVADWARPGLARMVAKKIISGMNGELRPGEPVTRAQVAKMLAFCNP